MCIAKNDNFFLDLVNKGVLEVTTDGTVYKDGKPTGYKNQSGYHRIEYRHGGKRYYTSAHRLNYLFHKGPIPPKHVIDHKDEDPTNNHLDNLEAVMNAENCRRGKERKGFGFKAYPRMTDTERHSIVEIYKLGIGLQTLMEMFDCSQTHIASILKGHTFHRKIGLYAAQPLVSCTK